MKPKNWIVVFKEGKWNAAINNHRNTVDNLIKQGWEIMGEPFFADKADAIDWVKACRAANPPQKNRKIKRDR